MAHKSLFFLFTSSLLASCSAQTIYYPKDTQVWFNAAAATAAPTTTTATGAAAFTGAAAYNSTTLVAPAAPTGIATTVPLQLYQGGMNGLSIQIPSNFMGFSIEMSVFNQYLGRNSSLLNVPFLNFVANVVARCGSMQIRVGGNSQETAELVQSIPNSNGSILSKDTQNVFNHNTPPIEYTADLFYMMNNISNLLDVAWYMGIPFFNTTPVDLNLAVAAEQILGTRLLALQAGNEPDLYAVNGRNHRADGYAPANYSDEIGSLIQQAQSSGMNRQSDIWLVPSISSSNDDGAWSLDAVWATNLVSTYAQSLYAVAVERYPNNNCAAVFNTGAGIVDAQATLPEYLNHSNVFSLQQQYVTAAQAAIGSSKPLILFETNTASCNGFSGISDAFVGALWGIDWAMTLMAGNFSAALFHFGGQTSFYNPFTPPPGNQTKIRQWTVGPIYYSTLFIAEALGKDNTSQVVDLTVNAGANSNQGLTPSWAIYENGVPKKVVVINYGNDPSGASSVTFNVAIGGGNSGQAASNPTSVQVKQLLAGSVTQKGNFTWAGQTFGEALSSDGRIQGQFSAQTVNCDTNNGCSVSVPAPGAALIFLSGDVYAEEDFSKTSAETFATTTNHKTANTIQIDYQALATSNGHMALSGDFMTSQRSKSSGAGLGAVVSRAFMAVAAVVAGGVVVLRRL